MKATISILLLIVGIINFLPVLGPVTRPAVPGLDCKRKVSEADE